MRYSKMFGKTVHQVAKDIASSGHRFLYQGGFVRESRAGRYYLLPLAMRVQEKICRVIEREMNKSGAQRLIAPVLHPVELWQETNRSESVKFELMTVTDRRGAKFVLGGTAEEMIVDLVRRFDISYRDLPINIYQFSTKFRDELRSRGGLLRTREFLMKDAYSFHVTEDDFRCQYDLMKDTYLRIFARLGLKAWVVEADNGYMGGDYCHEMVVEHQAGESTFFVADDNSCVVHQDIMKQREQQYSHLSFSAKCGIEVGNIFQLGRHYSDLMQGATFINPHGERLPFYMGCYGLGVDRTLATIAEVYCDEKGLIWPSSVAPYQVQLVLLGSDNEARAKADQVYAELLQNEIEVLYDDRDESAGKKFADSDLLGMPNRVVVSKKTFADGVVEHKRRDSAQNN